MAFVCETWRIPFIGEPAMMLPNRLVFKLGLKVGNPRGLPPSYIKEIIENFDQKTQAGSPATLSRY